MTNEVVTWVVSIVGSVDILTVISVLIAFLSYRHKIKKDKADEDALKIKEAEAKAKHEGIDKRTGRRVQDNTEEYAVYSRQENQRYLHRPYRQRPQDSRNHGRHHTEQPTAIHHHVPHKEGAQRHGVLSEDIRRGLCKIQKVYSPNNQDAYSSQNVKKWFLYCHVSLG